MGRITFDPDDDYPAVERLRGKAKRRVRPHGPTPPAHIINGPWRAVAEAVRDGAGDANAVALKLRASLADVERAILFMHRSGYLYTAKSSLRITDRCRRELRHDPAAQQ